MITSDHEPPTPYPLLLFHPVPYTHPDHLGKGTNYHRGSFHQSVKGYFVTLLDLCYVPDYTYTFLRDLLNRDCPSLFPKDLFLSRSVVSKDTGRGYFTKRKDCDVPPFVYSTLSMPMATCVVVLSEPSEEEHPLFCLGTPLKIGERTKNTT